MVEAVSDPSVFHERQRHTFRIIYHLEEALHVISVKSTDHVSSFVWMKSVL